MRVSFSLRAALLLSLLQSPYIRAFTTSTHSHARSANVVVLSQTPEEKGEAPTKDNKAMAFLKKVGRVGRKQDFTHALGVDEGEVGKASLSSLGALKKAPQAYASCTQSGILDDCQQPFPISSMGTSWSGFTDQVMGGQSHGVLVREPQFFGRVANVLRGSVRNLPGQPQKFGFVQMATNLVPENQVDGYVDASSYDGVEVDVLYQGEDEHESFNVHFKTLDCLAPFSSYRASFDLVQPETWQTIRVPFTTFQGHGPGAVGVPLDCSKLVRAGIVAIGKAYPNLSLGVAGMRFYKDS